MNGKIVITGAPGNVGTHVVEALRAAGLVDRMRVGARDADSARRTLGADVEIVPFDFTKPETFAAALDGIERLFLVRPPALSNVPRDIAPALEAAQTAGVRQIVFLSIQGVEQNRIVPHAKIETWITDHAVPYTFLRAGFFMQNLSTVHRDEVRERGVIAVPVGRARTSFVDARDLAAAAVVALTQPGHENRAYTLTGAEALTYYEVAAIMSRVLGRSIRYTNPNVVQFVVEQTRDGRPLPMALLMTALYTLTRFGNASAVTDDLARLIGRAPISFEQFVRDHSAVWHTP